MNKIEKLIEELCPDGVRYKHLWEVTTWDKRFNAVENSKQPEVVKYKYFLASELKPLIVVGGTIKILTTNISSLYTTEDLAEDNYSEGEIIAIPWGGNAIVQYFKGKFLTSDNRIAISNDTSCLNTKYLYYFILQNIDKISAFYRGAGIKHPNMAKVLDFKIPVPPLAIQEKIVEILDKFTQLEAELEAELEARKAQYQFYRNQLLAFENKNVEWKTLGEIGEFTRGKRFVRTDMIEEGFPCLHYGEMYTHYNVYAIESKSFISPELAKKLRVANPGDVIIVAAGETIEDIGKGTAWLGESDIVTHDACFSFKSPLNPKYVSYFLRTRLFHDQIKRHISSGKISSINAKGLAKAKIPVPPLSEQERIVKILDQFDDLINNISIGLPAEIKARKQQYEFYREKLLTFKEIQTIN